MIISRTPTRLSFCGGGTDHPEAIEAVHQGLVVGAALARYSFVSLRELPPFHEYTSRLIYSEIECVSKPEEITHRVFKKVFEKYSLDHLEIAHQCDLPSRSGVGSSSTFVVGLLKAVHAHLGIYRRPLELAWEAIDIERNLLKETVGYQDQTFAACGGLNILRFASDDIVVEPLTLREGVAEDFQKNLLMVYTGLPRISSKVASSYVPSLNERKRELHALLRMAEESISAIRSARWEALGGLIDRSWRLKVNLSKEVCSGELHRAYALARMSGAFGGKLMGAGGGGCFLLVAPPEKHKAIASNLKELLPQSVYIPVCFDWVGSTITSA